MPLSFNEFMKKTNNKGFTSEEQELLAGFGKALEKAYGSMCAEEENSAGYREHTEVREALGGMQGNSVFGPVPDDADEEKKKKWDEDMQRLVGFINMLRSGRNLSYFSDHAIGTQNGQLKDQQQYFSLLELLNKKLEAKLEHDEQRDLIPGYTQQQAQEESSEDPEKEEKSEPISEQARLEIEEKNWQVKEKILDEWAYVGDVDDIGEQSSFQDILLKASKGLNVKQWKFMDNSAKELAELKNAISEYNIFLMNRSDGNESEHCESKYLKDIADAAEKYIHKKRGDDPNHPGNNKPDNWEPMFKSARTCFASAKDVLELTKEKLKEVEKEEKAAAASDPDELLERVAKNGRKSLRKRRSTVRKNTEKGNKPEASADISGKPAEKNASPAKKVHNSKVIQQVSSKVGRASTGGTRQNSTAHRNEGEHTIKRSKTLGMK